jgi:hypothetical protein
LSKPQPHFHDLEFSNDADFWAGSDVSRYRVFLMPVTTPSEFLAFGVLEPSNRVHFVARGRLKDHLVAFITHMERARAQIELYVRPPLPGNILKRYTSGPPIEGQEAEEPSGPTVKGLAPGSATSYVESRGASLWTEGDVSSRRVFLAPARESAEFLASGMLASGKVLFSLVGSVQEHLAEFVARMVEDQARLELHSQLPAR